MGSQMTRFTPAWARNAVMNVVLGKYQDTSCHLISESDLVADCISRVPAFDDLFEDTQNFIVDLLFEAVSELVDEDFILVDEVIFQINPNLPDLMRKRHLMCILPKWGSA
jgi:hypothetical protein